MLATTSLSRLLCKFSSKMPLSIVLIIAFVIQIVISVGITGWVSFSNGQKAVNELAKQLRAEVTLQVEQHLKNYLMIPHLVNQVNLDAIQQGLLDLKDTQALSHYFCKQVQRFKTVSYIGLGTEHATYVGAKLLESGLITFEIADESTEFALKSWRTDPSFSQTELKSTSSRYDPRTRPWYRVAVNAGQAVWSNVYAYISGKSTGISANQPFYDSQGQLIAVSTVDLTLLDISHFLSRLDISQQGQIFIMDRFGTLIATSTGEKPFRIRRNKQVEQFKAIQSENETTQATVTYLTQQFSHLGNIKDQYQTDFSLRDERHLLQVVPFVDKYGLDWLIVTVIPEHYFMSQIRANNLMTMILLFLFSIIASFIGVLIARWIVQPILDLKHASQRLVYDHWDNRLPIERSDEIGDLAKTFNYMSQQLQISFAILHNNETHLKQLNQAYERFVPREFLSLLNKQSVLDVNLGDQIAKEMTILFSDIRGFTSLSERMTPQENFNFINSYLSEMEPIITEYHGFIDKYIGDAIMALFPTHADDAVQGAIAMLKALELYNQKRQYLDQPAIQIGIGLNTGPLMLGTVGGKNRMEGTVIADAVNLASRVESLTKIYGTSLLITTQTYLKLAKASRYRIRVIDSVMIKGKSEVVTVYEIFDADPPERVALKDATSLEFEQAFVLYHSGEFEEAMNFFKKVLKVNPQDGVARIYLERCQQSL